MLSSQISPMHNLPRPLGRLNPPKRFLLFPRGLVRVSKGPPNQVELEHSLRLLNLPLHRLQLLNIPIAPQEPAPQEIRLGAAQPHTDRRRQLRRITSHGGHARLLAHLALDHPGVQVEHAHVQVLGRELVHQPRGARLGCDVGGHRTHVVDVRGTCVDGD